MGPAFAGTTLFVWEGRDLELFARD